MKLISALPSPFVRKVRIALIEKGIPFTTVVDNPWSVDCEVARHNPLGKVPTLILDGGRILYDSKVIVGFLETLNREPRLLPDEPSLRVEHRQIEALADSVCDAVVLIVQERARSPDLQSQDWIHRQFGKVESGVAEAARVLGTRSLYVANQFGLADVAVGCMLGYLDLRLAEFRWRERHANLITLAEKLARRSSFAQSLPEAQSLREVR